MRDYSMRRLEKSADDLDTAQINYKAGKEHVENRLKSE